MPTDREVTLKDGTSLKGEAAKAYGRSEPLAPAVPASTSITTESSVSEPPITIPDVPAATEAVGLEGELSTLTAGTTSDLAKRREEAQKKSETSFEQYIKSLGESEGKTQLESEAFGKKGGVDDIQKELDDINQQMRAEQEALRKQVEAIETQGGGSFAGKQASVAEARRVSLRKQADLAIVQLSRQGRFDSAKTIADRAVAAEMEQDYRRTTILGKIYEDNKDLFTKAEQREFEVAQDIRKTADANKEFRLRAEYEQKLKQSDPLYQAQLSKARTELAGGNVTITNPTAGRYAGALGIILGSGKFTKDQKESLIASVNNGEDPYQVIKNQAKGILGQTGETKLTQYEVAKEQLENVKVSLDTYYAAGGRTDLLSGKYENVINKLGTVEDPKLVEIATEIASSLQIYRNAVSGTAYSVQEGQDIAAIFPGINKSEGLNDAILAGRMRAFDSTIDSTYRSALGSTYDTLKAVDEAGVKGTTSDTDFVETTLNSIGASYQEVLDKTPSGQIPVIDNKTGQVGYISPGEFVANRYTKL